MNYILLTWAISVSYSLIAALTVYYDFRVLFYGSNTLELSMGRTGLYWLPTLLIAAPALLMLNLFDYLEPTE